MLFGDGYWRREPGEEYLAALGATADELPDLAGTIAAGEELGLTPLYAVTTSVEEFDRYEWSLVAERRAVRGRAPGRARRRRVPRVDPERPAPLPRARRPRHARVRAVPVRASVASGRAVSSSPGWGGPRGLYAACVPDGWEILEPPPFRATGGDLAAYRRWLGDEIARARAAAHASPATRWARRSRCYAALDDPGAVEPARPDLAGRAAAPEADLEERAEPRSTRSPRALPGGRALARDETDVAAPRAALRLAHTLRELDLAPELEQRPCGGIPCTVIGCATDRLTTPAICRRLASDSAPSYRELDVEGGHVWMLHRPELLRTSSRRRATRSDTSRTRV